MNNFEKLGLHSDILKGIADLGFEQPTPIQQEAIPQLLEGSRDLIGLAKTGTGKTAAFGLPLLQMLDFHSKTTQALILAPTRELCVQINRDLQNFSKHLTNFRSVAVYGGASIQEQIRAIKNGVQVIVATPGRLIDLITRKVVKLNDVSIVVLDEADEMLNMGFQEDIDQILSSTPSTRNTWLFSATMPDEVRRIAKNYMHDPYELSVGRKNEGAENIEHIYYIVHARDRYAALKRIADANPDIFAIIFCRTKIETQEVAEHLIRDGYNADSLHGDLSQQQRDKVMGRYRDRSLQLLVATDVAARGIDVNDVTHVIQYNLPDEIENYTHRSGRTARAGKSGVSIAIIHMKELYKIKQIEKQMNCKFTQARIPGGKEICEKQLMHLVKRVHDVQINEKEIDRFLPSIHEELSDLDREELIKRFFSIEFNRFLNYYKKAPDLNVEAHQRDRDRDRNPDYESHGRRDKRERGEGSYRSKGARLFINIGSKDGLDKGKLLRFICDTTGEDNSIFGRIDIKGVYSFVDVDPHKMNNVMDALNGSEYKKRNVRVEISGDGRKEGGSESKGFKKDRNKERSSPMPGRDEDIVYGNYSNEKLHRNKSSWEDLMAEDERGGKKSRRNKFKKQLR